jgi:trigger factor
VVIDDELGKAVGLESLAELRDEVRQQMQRDYQTASRLRLKRSLLDRLARNYDFAVPPGMVELEFENIWRQHEAEKERAAQQEGTAAEPVTVVSAAGEEPVQETPPPETPDTATGEQVADAASPEPVQAEGEISPNPAQVVDQEADTKEDDEALKAEYRRIAERRVRLGLLLAEVGRNNNITVTQDEMNQAITREARRHPGYERQVLDFYRQNPDAVANLRAPVFEDKVVDFIVELAKVQERKISPQELLTLPESDDTNGPPASERDASAPDASGAAAD